MKLMFTGTQQGMTKHQHNVIYDWILMRDAIIEEIRHGGCIGADKEFHDICNNFNLGELIEIHPSNIPSKTAEFPPASYRVMRSAAPPLDRNLDMVEASEVCLATPKEADEILRSGTWATIRYARKNHLRVFVVEPDGTVVID